jgi:hypothetical protein
MRISIPNINNDEAISTFIRGLRHHDALRTKLLRKRPDLVQDLLTVVKKWADADEADQQIKEDVGRAPHPDQQNCSLDDQRDDRRRDDRRDDRRNDNRNRRNDNYDRRRQDNSATDQLIMPSTLSSQRPSTTMRMPISRSFRVLAWLIWISAIQWGIVGV